MKKKVINPRSLPVVLKFDLVDKTIKLEAEDELVLTIISLDGTAEVSAILRDGHVIWENITGI